MRNIVNQNQIFRRQLVQFGTMLHSAGFVSGTDGNLSVRISSTKVLVTPTGVSKAMMNPEDMVMVDLSGRKISGKCDASSEIAMHLAIYDRRPDVNAVVHAHPCTATGFASAGIALDEPICSEVLITLGEVPIAPYASPGSSELGTALASLVHDHDAILMSNHGVVTCGETLLRAYLNMECVEHFAKIVLVTKQLGRSNLLTAENIEYLRKARIRYRGLELKKSSASETVIATI